MILEVKRYWKKKNWKARLIETVWLFFALESTRSVSDFSNNNNKERKRWKSFFLVFYWKISNKKIIGTEEEKKTHLTLKWWNEISFFFCSNWKSSGQTPRSHYRFKMLRSSSISCIGFFFRITDTNDAHTNWTTILLPQKV